MCNSFVVISRIRSRKALGTPRQDGGKRKRNLPLMSTGLGLAPSHNKVTTSTLLQTTALQAESDLAIKAGIT